VASADVVVIGAGHNGLACACYLARAGLEVTVLEAGAEPGGCIHTLDLPDGRGRLEIGAYEHGGIRASGVAADLELESRFGLRFHMRDELVLSPCDDGSALAFHKSLDRTVEGLSEVVGPSEADSYRRFAEWGEAAAAVLTQADSGPPPTLRELAALADVSLGAEGQRLVQSLLASASNLTAGMLDDERLRATLEHWAAHSQQPPSDPGTGAGAILFASFHGSPAARPAGGSRSTVTALVRCLEHAGGTLRCDAPVDRVEVSGGRAVAVEAAGERYEAARAVVSAVDAKRLFERMVDPGAVPAALREELRRVHVGRQNVSELKVDAVIESLPEVPGPAGYERSLLLSPNTSTDIEGSFREIALGRVPDRGPLMIAFPSTLDDDWAPDGRAVIWLSTFVPWRLAEGPWDEAALERASDHAWKLAERVLGSEMRPVERRLTGPPEWVERHGNPAANPNHVEMSIDQLLAFRPSPSLSHYRTPLEGLFLTGAGTHPGGGVTGAPGRNAAAVVMAELGMRRKGSRVRSQLALLRDAARAARSLRKAA